MSDEKLQVIPLEEHDKAFKSVSDDMLALREQMKTDAESTKVALDERKDDLAKYGKAVEEIQEKYQTLATEVKEARRLSAATVGDRELATEIKSIGESFRVPQEKDADYREMPAGSKPTVKNLIEGVMRPDGSFYEAQHADIQELQALNDSCLIADALMSHYGGNSYRASGGMQSLKVFRELMRKSEAVFKGDTDLVDTDNISNWVPTHFSTQVYNIVKAGLPELNIFQEIPMPGKTFDLNVNLTDVSADVIPETTTIAGMDPFADTDSQAINDAKATLTAAKFRARIPFTGEADEDAIVAQMPLIRSAIIRALMEGKADAIFNGDADGDLDTGGTHYGRANAATGVDPRTAFDGLRSFSNDNTATPSVRVDVSNADLKASHLLSIRRTMGEWGLDPADLVHILGVNAYLGLLADSDLKTMDQVGDRATLITGSVGAVNGSSVVVSRRVPQNANASGIMDGTTTDRTLAMTVNRQGAIVGNRRRDTIGQDRYGVTDSIDMFVFSRIGFTQLFGNTKPWLSEAYNVATN